MTSTYEGVYTNQSRVPGVFRLNDRGIGWKPNEVKKTGGSIRVPDTLLLPRQEIDAVFWSRGARGFEVRVQTKTQGVIQIDGFQNDDFNSLKNDYSKLYNVPLEIRDHSLRGWNWGKADFGRNEMSFDVGDKPAFEIPYKDVANSNLVGRNEVAIEFNLPNPSERLKAGDELVEIRFHVPGTAKNEETDEKKEDGEDVIVVEGEQSAATVFYESLKERADIGESANEAIVSLEEVMFLTPRGRYDIDMYTQSFRLRGKTYDYKIPYKHVQRMFLLPKPDGIHNMLILQLDPPLRQGQTRYPFLIMQFQRDAVLTVSLNVDEEEYEKNYKNKIKQQYDELIHKAVAEIFRGLTGSKLLVPGPSFKNGGADEGNEPGISCSLKASEGYLFPLETCLLFVPKPTVYIPLSEVSTVTFSRVGNSASSSSRTFDMSVRLSSNVEHQFSNISREEQSHFEKYIKLKNIRIEKDMGDQPMLDMDIGSESDDDMPNIRGSADEDEESPDEDYHAESESDVAEEFDSNHSSGSESEADFSGDESDDGERPAKKAKR